MAKKNRKDAKIDSLQHQGALNPYPETVLNSLFQGSDFFSPHDIVQVKYEMLRRVLIDGYPISRAAIEFGFSRPSFYQAQANFKQAGLPGLIPQKPGPRRAHKLTPEIVAFINQVKTEQENIGVTKLAKLVKEQLGISIHPRTIERSKASKQKKRP